MSKKVTMLSLNGYYNYIQLPDSMSADAVLDLMQAQMYKKDYQRPWELSETKPEFIFVDPEELPKILNATTINMNEVLAENNRLTRENERLKEQLNKTSKSTELEIL